MVGVEKAAGCSVPLVVQSPDWRMMPRSYYCSHYSAIEGCPTQRSFGRRAEVVLSYGVTTKYRSCHYWSEIDGSLLFSITLQHPE